MRENQFRQVCRLALPSPLPPSFVLIFRNKYFGLLDFVVSFLVCLDNGNDTTFLLIKVQDKMGEEDDQFPFLLLLLRLFSTLCPPNFLFTSTPTPNIFTLL